MAKIRRLAKKLVPISFLVVFVIGQLAPVAAVRPQEGWYVRDKMTYTVSGVEREYFIIDNKMSSDPWYVTFQSYMRVLPDPLLMTPNWGLSGLDVNWNVLLCMNTYYRGYSEVDWSVDDDWLCLLDWDGVRYSNVDFGSNSPGFSVVIFDKSKVPLLTYDNSSDAYSITGGIDCLLGRSYTADTVASPFSAHNTVFYDTSGSAVIRLGGSAQVTVGASDMLFNPFLAGLSSDASIYDVDGTSINDLCVVPYVRGFTPQTGLQRTLQCRLAVAWAVPVDKCPAGTQVGDSWPKVRPLEVQMDDAYKAWMDSALANTPVADSSQVGEQIQDYNKQLEASDDWGELATAGWAFVQPIFDSFDFVFVILGIAAVSFVLLLLIKKGMS